MRKITNIGASNFNPLLKHYLQERFLYRLSKSTYKDNFMLKGGLLLITVDIPSSRPTMDIDLLIHKLGNTKVMDAFKEILSIEYPDGVKFDANSLQSEPITKDGAYHGTRLKFKAYLNTSHNDMSIDLGLGDYVINPREITFPTILNEDAPVLTAYSLETIVAEKLEAMVKLLYANSRMKDFYDVYTILNTHTLSGKTLAKAIKGTFEHRQTPSNGLMRVFSPDFYDLPDKQIQWKAFLTKNKIVNVPSEFSHIVKGIEEKLHSLKII